MTVPTIEVDMNKACQQCGVMGATAAGVCLECATSDTTLLGRSLDSALAQMSSLINAHRTDIHVAWIKSHEDKVSIGLTVELSPSNEKPNTILVKTKINFIESRIKDEMSDQVSNQQKLPM